MAQLPTAAMPTITTITAPVDTGAADSTSLSGAAVLSAAAVFMRAWAATPTGANLRARAVKPAGANRRRRLQLLLQWR